MAPPNDAFQKLQAGGFADWRLTIDGMVARPGAFSLDQLKAIHRAARSRSSRAKKVGRMWLSGLGASVARSRSRRRPTGSEICCVLLD